MTRRPAVGALLLVVVAAATALVVALVGWERSGERAGSTVGAVPTVPVPSETEPPTVQPPQRGASAPISARADLLPRNVFFGDTVRGRVDVVLDRARVDPDSIRVAAAFSPWELVGRPQRLRRDAGSTTFIRTTYVLRCVASPCVPSGQAAPLYFDSARVSYARAGRANAEPRRLRLRWPVLTVYSRFASASFEGRRNLATPWRAEVRELPDPSYPLRPLLVTGVLGALGLLLLAGSAGLAYVAWPRPAPPPPVPEAPPPPRLTPLEQALVLLEDAAREDGAEDRRRSLELVAEALEEWGDADLARWARVLAWSENTPETDETADLAARVRSTLEREREREAAEVSGSVA